MNVGFDNMILSHTQTGEQLLIESSSDEEEVEDDDEGGDTAKKGVNPSSSDGLIDMEDMGKVMKKMKAAAKKRKEEEEGKAVGELREMVTPMLHKALTKQGE